MSKRVIHSMIFGARTGVVADAVFASEAQRRRENQDERVALDDRHSTFARPVGLDTFVTVYRGPTAIGLLVLPGGGSAADVRLAALEYLAELDNASK